MTPLQLVLFAAFPITVALLVVGFAHAAGIVKGWIEGDDE